MTTLEWVTPAFLLGVGGLVLTLLAQLSKALSSFETHIRTQALLGATVERLDNTVVELKGDVRDLQGVLRNGLNARLAELQHTVEMNRQYCLMRGGEVEARFEHIENRIDE